MSESKKTVFVVGLGPGGGQFLTVQAQSALQQAEVLCGFPVADDEGMMQAAKLLSGKTNGAVLVKGGHRADTADDLLVLPDGRHAWLRRSASPPATPTEPAVRSPAPSQAVWHRGTASSRRFAARKGFVRGALSTGLDLGQGSGPLDHMWCHGKPHLPYSA